MKRILHLALISIFFGGVAIYLADNVISPYNAKGEVDIANIVLVLSVLSISLYFLFSAIISLLNKLFFRKFYESPNYRFAFINAFIIVSLLDIALALRIIYERWDTSYALVLFAVWITLISFQIFRRR